MVFGSFTQQIITRHPGQTELVAVKFMPGQLTPFCHLPGIELTDTSTAIETLWGTCGRELQDKIFSSDKISRIIALLEKSLLARLAHGHSTDVRISAALRMILERHGRISIEDLARRVGLSRRHFERRFAEMVGLTPKRLCRMARFSGIFSHLNPSGKKDWADLSVAGGYSDQAHLIRECKFFTGASPISYLKRRSPLERKIMEFSVNISHFFNTKVSSIVRMDKNHPP